MATRVSSPELIGRANELAALEAAFERAAGGSPAAVLVAGESGVGKSRLVAEFCERIERAGGLVLAGECVELTEGEIPFAPIVSALRMLSRRVDDADLDAILGPARGELTRFFPELAHEPAAAAGVELGPLGQARLFELLLGVCARLGEQQPVVVIIEDLHWADRSTRDLLLFLARSLRSERLLFVVTYRSDELHRRHPLRPFLVQLEATRVVQRVDLGPLSRDEVADQLARILGDLPGSALIDAVYVRSEGNPLFTEELAVSGGCESPGSLPDTLRDALVLRVERLPEAAQQAVRIAAAAGRRTSHRLLAAVAELPERDLLDALREAVGAHVLVEAGDDGAYEFRHALLREAVYADLLPGERGKLHIELARAIEADPALAGREAAAAAELAYHWYAAHELEAALRASIDAGFEAEQLCAFAEAQTHFERALSLWERVPGEWRVDRPELLRRAASSAHNAGETERAVALGQELVHELESMDEVEALSLALVWLGRYLFVVGRGEQALPVHRRAVEILPAAPTLTRAQALAAEGQILMLSDRVNEARARCDEALPIAQAVGARDVEVNILNSLIAIATYSGDVSTALDYTERARALAEELEVPEEIFRSYVNGSDALDQAGRVEESIELALKGADAARRVGLDRHSGQFLRSEAASRLVRLGRWEEAERIAEEVLSGGTNALSLVIAIDAIATLALERGDLARARTLLEEAVARLSHQTGSMWLAQSNTPLTRLALSEGRPDEAHRLVAEALEETGDGEYVFFTAGLYAHGVRAEADIAERARPLRDADVVADCERRAVELVERFDARLADFDEHPAPPQALAWRAMAEGELARLRGAADPAPWAEAAERFDALGQIADAAHARFRQADAMVRARAPRKDVGEVLALALEPATRVQMEPLVRQIEALARRARVKLDAAGAQPAEAPDPTDVIGLTQRELEVVALVAAGYTNREIGERLYMSEKTASVHVSRILSKLGASNRAEAAASAERLGLVPSS